MSQFDTIDFFTDQSLVNDPYPYFEYLRSKGPITRLPHRNVVAVTGFEEAIAIVNDTRNFSSAISTHGPIPELPFTPTGDDIAEQLEQFREYIPAYGMIVTMDGTRHAKTRSLLMRLFTPRRLKELEAFLGTCADRQIDEFIDRGHCEIISEYGSPYATIVIASLLGIPEEDWKLFRENLVLPAQMDTDTAQAAMEGFSFLLTYFTDYISDRRATPRDDVLSELAAAKFPDGSTPDVMDLVWVAAFLFGAGMDTTARLLSACMRILAERPDLQARLRGEPQRIPDFIEEALRIEGPVKCTSRLAVRTTTVAGVEIPASTTVAIFSGAINRDPRRFERPSEILLDRPKAREHFAFGRGAHTCAGAPLARTEVRFSLERLLQRLDDIRISDSHHGPAGNRSFAYDPVYTLRGLKHLYLDFTPGAASSASRPD